MTQELKERTYEIYLFNAEGEEVKSETVTDFTALLALENLLDKGNFFDAPTHAEIFMDNGYSINHTLG